MTRKLILHIGAHKTGTTSIQNFLKSNEGLLKEQGWTLFYRKPEGFNSKDGSANSWINFSGSADSFHATVNTDLFTELRRIKSNVIISCEELFWLDTYDSIKKFAESMQSIYDEIYVVCYLRRQDQHLFSHYQQGFKFPDSSARAFYGFTANLIPTHKDYYKSYLDYSRKISYWAKCFNNSNLFVRLYSREALVEQDSVKDFCSLLPLDSYDLNFSYVHINESLNKLQILLNDSVFRARHDLWYEIGRTKFTNSKFFKTESVSASSIYDSRIMSHYYQSNKILAGFLNNLPFDWLSPRGDSFEVKQPEFTKEDYDNALISLVNYYDDMSLFTLCKAKLFKLIKVKNIELLIRNKMALIRKAIVRGAQF